ncbi:hypothetical protein SETIT_2G084200v2 [Setaria italica]|uniref:Uncharacterized protein n=1 Tax=Setaria italica TaxID=4555 RepID=A0A368PWC5_SETIT|nr:hypothetical protein SETIT_2G084200v2 [Setaria italica]
MSKNRILCSSSGNSASPEVSVPDVIGEAEFSRDAQSVPSNGQLNTLVCGRNVDEACDMLSIPEVRKQNIGIASSLRNQQIQERPFIVKALSVKKGISKNRRGETHPKAHPGKNDASDHVSGGTSSCSDTEEKDQLKARLLEKTTSLSQIDERLDKKEQTIAKLEEELGRARGEAHKIAEEKERSGWGGARRGEWMKRWAERKMERRGGAYQQRMARSPREHHRRSDGGASAERRGSSTGGDAAQQDKREVEGEAQPEGAARGDAARGSSSAAPGDEAGASAARGLTTKQERMGVGEEIERIREK